MLQKLQNWEQKNPSGLEVKEVKIQGGSESWGGKNPEGEASIKSIVSVLFHVVQRVVVEKMKIHGIYYSLNLKNDLLHMGGVQFFLESAYYKHAFFVI